MSALRRPFATADGHICLMPYTDAHWHDFFTEIGAAHLAADSRFVGIHARTANINALYKEVGQFIQRQPTDHWLATCERLQIPAAPILAIDGLPFDAHLEATEFFLSANDPQIGRVRFPGVPVRFNGVRPGITMPPRLGEHTQEILRTIGIDPDSPWAKPSVVPSINKAGA